MTIFIGTSNLDTIIPEFVSAGVRRIGPDATPGDGDDVIFARSGDDVVAGGLGDDAAFLGAGDDLFGWRPADGSDAVFGQSGFDRLIFDGDGSDETFRVTKVGGETRLVRDVGEVTMRLTGVEAIQLLAGAGEDRIEIGDMRRADVDRFDVSLSAPGRSGDGATDEIVLTGGAALEDIVVASGPGAALRVTGLAAEVLLSGVEATDGLTIVGGGGNDGLNAIGVRSGQARLRLDGGAGGDFIFGSRGADLVLGGDGDDRLAAAAGDDLVVGGRGDEIALLGAGDDVFTWAPGEGNDGVAGDAGIDTLAFDGSDDGEVIEIFADGRDAVLLRDVGDVRMDMETVERIDLSLFGGTDEVTVRNVASTDLAKVVIDLSAPDGAADFLIIEGTEGADDVTIGVDGDAVVVTGLSATIRILGAEDGLDQLLFRGFGGDDEIDASALSGIGLSVQAGDGDDVLLGSLFGDRLSGDAGDDRISANGGDDVLFGGAGRDVLDGGAGFDQLSGDASDEFRNGEIIFDGGLFA